MTSWHDRLRAGATYLALSFTFHLVWEVAQAPLYTVWTTGSRGELAYDVLHCTVGDIIIAAVSLAAALVVTRSGAWPNRERRASTGVALMLGLGYTAFSEWHNVYVAKAWTYASSMPLLHVGGIAIGLSPLLQWIVVPAVALAVLHRKLGIAEHVRGN